MGYGINTGPTILGIVGETERIDANAISDAINTASRVEGLTKMYRVPLLVADNTIDALADRHTYSMRVIDKVRLKGKREAHYIYQVFDAKEAPAAQLLKAYHLAFAEYETGNFEKAITLFSSYRNAYPDDYPTELLIQRCQEYLRQGVGTNWDCTVDLFEK